jgi:hypothetical protein
MQPRYPAHGLSSDSLQNGRIELPDYGRRPDSINCRPVRRRRDTIMRTRTDAAARSAQESRNRLLDELELSAARGGRPGAGQRPPSPYLWRGPHRGDDGARAHTSSTALSSFKIGKNEQVRPGELSGTLRGHIRENSTDSLRLSAGHARNLPAKPRR